MFFFTKSLLGLDLHDHLVQFVELKKKGKKVELQTYNRLTIPEGLIDGGQVKNEPELRELLRKLLVDANPPAAKAKELAVILPTQVTFIHIFTFPSKLTEKDLKKFIPVEAENILPFAIEEMYWDFTVIQKEKAGSQRVLFAATPKMVADQYSKIFTELGLTPRLFGIQPESLSSALSFKLPNGKNSVLVELGALASNYLFMKGPLIQKFVSINGGIEALVQKLSTEFNVPGDQIWSNWETFKTDARFQQSIKDFIGSEYKHIRTILNETLGAELKSLNTLILTGEFSNLPDFFDEARLFFSEIEVEIGDPKSNLIIDDRKFASNLEKLGGRVPYSIYFTNAVGVTLRALKGVRSAVNLIPDALKSEFSEKKIAFILGASSILMTFIAAILSGVVFYQNRVLTYDRLNLEIDRSGVEKTLFGTRYQDIKEELTTFNQEVSALTKIDQTLISVPTVIEQILALISPEIRVLEITYYDADLSIKIMGVAQNRQQLLDLQASLESDPLVEEFEIPLSAYDQKSETAFTVTIFLNFSQLPSYAASSKL